MKMNFFKLATAAANAGMIQSIDGASARSKQREAQRMERYEIFTSYAVGSTAKKYNVGDIIPSMGFGTPDYRIWKIDHENKRYYVEELD